MSNKTLYDLYSAENYPVYEFKDGFVICSADRIIILKSDKHTIIDMYIIDDNDKLLSFRKTRNGFELYYTNQIVYKYQNCEMVVDGENIELNFYINNENKQIIIYNNGFTSQDINVMANKNYYFNFLKKLWLYTSLVGNLYKYKEMTVYEINKSLLYQVNSEIIVSKPDQSSYILDKISNCLINSFTVENNIFYLTYENDLTKVYNL